jgi:hypothetical protein
MTQPTPITDGMPDDLTARLKRAFFVPPMLTTLVVFVTGVVMLAVAGTAIGFAGAVAPGILAAMSLVFTLAQRSPAEKPRGSVPSR